MDPTSRTLDGLLRHERFVRRLARSLLRAPHEVDDLVQETWLRAVEHPPRPGGSAAGWLGTVVRNLASDWRLGASRRAKREAAAARPETTPPLQQVIERQELQKKVVGALARIPEAHASAIVLRYFDGLPPREIARRLSIPVATVKKRLTRGLSELRAELDGAFERGRAGWTAALPLLAGVPATGVAATATAVALPAAIAGGIIVSTKAKIACAAVVLAIGAFFAMRALPRLQGPAASPVPPTDSGAAIAGGPGANQAAPPKISPKPFREEPSESAPATAASDRLEVVVLDDEDRPVIGSVVVFRPDGTIVHRYGDFDSRWPQKHVFPAVTLPASIGVVPYNRPPVVEELLRGSGSVTIRPRKGAVVSGRVLVNGSVPRQNIELRLYPVPPYKAIDSWPPVIDRVMKEQDLEAPQLRCWIDLKDGTFRFWGLHEEHRAVLWAPQGYRVDGQERGDVRLDKPESGLVVNLVEVPKLRGRVVAGPKRAPESRASLSLMSYRSDGGALSTGDAFSGPDGRFEMPLDVREQFASGTLAVTTQGGVVAREIKLTGNDLVNGRDLGDLEIEQARKVAIRVETKDSTPVPRARVLVPSGETFTLIGTSADDGRAEVALRPGPVLLRVAACGFEPVETQIAAGASEATIVLGPTTRLQVRAVLADGRTPAGWASVWLESTQQVLDPSARSEHQYFPPREPDWEATAWSGNESGTEIKLGGSPVTISGVRSGLRITVWAHDTISDVKASQVVTLAPAEQKTVVITLDVAARALRGRVVDPAGEPVYQADVALESNRRDVSRQVTNRDGSFSFDPITLDKVRMTVAVRGYARWIQEVAIPKEGTDVLVQLEAAEPVTFSVVDGRGKPAAGAFLAIPEINQFGGWRTDPEGRFTMSSCPRGEHEIHVNFGWISVVERRKLPARSVTITLPPFGPVEVLPLAGFDPRTSFVHLVALSPEAKVSPSLDIPEGETPVVSNAVPVGSYRVELRERTEGGKVGKLLLAGPTIEVKDGERTTIDFRSPR